MFELCHQLAERSFCWPDIGCLPLCARCTGLVSGYLLGLIVTRTLGLWYGPKRVLLTAGLMMVLNGITLVAVGLDTNLIRFFLGALWGAAFTVGARFHFPWGRRFRAQAVPSV